MSDDRMPIPYEPAPMPAAPGPHADLRTYAVVVHGLYAASFFTGFTSIVGLVIAYIKRGETVGTIYESHMTYAIRTFWISLLLIVAGLATTLLFIGVAILALAGIWYIARCVRPLVAWLDHKPIANPEGFF